MTSGVYVSATWKMYLFIDRTSPTLGILMKGSAIEKARADDLANAAPSVLHNQQTHTHTHTQLGGMLEGEEQYIAFSFHVKTAFGMHFNKTPLTKKSGLE